MNFEFNKIAGAVLGTALGVMVVGIVADEIYAPRVSEQPGFIIAVAEPGEGGGEAPAAPTVEPIADRLQVASVEDGAGDVAKCKTCHTFEQGGANKVGPNLWDVVGHNVIHGNFAYSDAMRAKGAEGLEWTFENLDHFIENPKKFIPGTAMSFAGVKDPAQRADIIAYLRTLSDNPVPLPPPTPAAGSAEVTPAETENPPAATESLTPPEPATPPATEEPAPAPAPEPATPPAAEPAPEPTTPPAAEPAPAPEPTAPAVTEPETPAPAAPAAETPAPAPEATPPANDQPASSGPSDGASPSPAVVPEPAAPEATPPAASEPPATPAPDAEADSPEGAPAAETPAQ